MKYNCNHKHHKENEKYYAVCRGKKWGIFRDWYECELSVCDVDKAKYAKFNCLIDAVLWLRDNDSFPIPNNKKSKLSYDDFEKTSHNVRLQISECIMAMIESYMYNKLVICKICDSHVYNALTRYIFDWKERGYLTTQGKHVNNSDLYSICADMLELDEVQVDVIYVGKDFSTMSNNK